jgi:hypothetical protein
LDAPDGRRFLWSNENGIRVRRARTQNATEQQIRPGAGPRLHLLLCCFDDLLF